MVEGFICPTDPSGYFVRGGVAPGKLSHTKYIMGDVNTKSYWDMESSYWLDIFRLTSTHGSSFGTSFLERC